MRGGVINDAEITPQLLVDGSYICGSELIQLDNLKADFTIIKGPLLTTALAAKDPLLKGLYKANGNYYLIKFDKVPTRTDAAGNPVSIIYVKKDTP